VGKLPNFLEEIGKWMRELPISLIHLPISSREMYKSSEETVCLKALLLYLEGALFNRQPHHLRFALVLENRGARFMEAACELGNRYFKAWRLV